MARAGATIARVVARIAAEPQRNEWPRLGAAGIGNPLLLGAAMDMQDAARDLARALYEVAAPRAPERWRELADLLDGIAAAVES